MLKDFVRNKVYVVDGGQCSFGIESTVAKLDVSDGADGIVKKRILVLRRGGVSEEALRKALEEEGLLGEVSVEAVGKNHFKEESENLEAPGQFLRHYSPNIESFFLHL